MTKPLGYYTSYTPGDEGLLAEMQAAWGTAFEKLNNVDRLWMITHLAEELCTLVEEELKIETIPDDVVDAVDRAFEELPISDRIGLIEALVNQLKSC
jgi:hypothetical protein